MTDFRTRRKDKQVFPIASGKEYRRVDDYEQNNPPEESPPEEKVLEEKMQEQKAHKKHKCNKELMY